MLFKYILHILYLLREVRIVIKITIALYDKLMRLKLLRYY